MIFIPRAESSITIRKAQILIPFFNRRLADYAQLAGLDLITFRNEMIAAIVGAAIGVASLLLLLGFVCVAVIITEWDTRIAFALLG
jgi:hypothetical protein